MSIFSISRALVVLALLGLPARVEAAWALVQSATASGNDATVTLGVAAGAANHVLILASMTNEGNTIAITNTTLSFSTLAGPADSAGFTIRLYIFCAQGDGVDATFVVETSATAVAQSVAGEFSGGSCTADGASSSNDDSDDTAYALTTDVTVTGSDSLIVSVIRSDSAADFAAGADMTQLDADIGATVAIYRILTASGTFDTPFTSAATENATLLSIGIAAAGSTGAGPPNNRRLLGGVGCAC